MAEEVALEDPGMGKGERLAKKTIPCFCIISRVVRVLFSPLYGDEEKALGFGGRQEVE